MRALTTHYYESVRVGRVRFRTFLMPQQRIAEETTSVSGLRGRHGVLCRHRQDAAAGSVHQIPGMRRLVRAE